MKNNNKPKKTLVYDNGFFRVYDEKNYIILEAVKGGAVVIPITQGRKIVLSKTFRPRINQTLWELPRGFKEINETPEENAKRELSEEIQGDAVNYLDAGKGAVDTGIMDSIVDYIIAENAIYNPDECQKEEGILTACEFTLGEVYSMIRCGQIIDSFTIIGITKAVAILGTGYFE